MITTNETLTEKFARKGLWLYIFTFLVAPIGYIIKMILSQDLSVSEIGALYWIISFLWLLNIYSDLGMVESLNYFLPKYAVKKEYQSIKYLLSFTFVVQLLSSIVVSLVVYLTAEWLAIHYFHDLHIVGMIRIASLYFIGLWLIHFTTAIFSSLQYVKLQKGIDAVRAIATLLWTAILFFAGSGSMTSYMWCWIIGIFSWSLFGLFFMIRNIYNPYLSHVIYKKDIEIRKNFVYYSAATFLTSNVAVLLSQVDIQLVVYLLGTKEAWFYSNYLSLIGIPFIFLSPILWFLFPVISEFSGSGNTKKICTIVQTFTLYLCIIGIWVSVVFLLLGDAMSIGFFTDKFRESGIILKFSAPFIVFNLLIQLHFQILSGIGKIRAKFLMFAVVLPINIFLNLLFILYFKMWARGSALAVGISWIPLYLMSGYFIREYITMIDFRMILLNIWGCTIYGIITYGVLLNLMVETRWEYIITFLVAIIFAFAIFIPINYRLIKDFLISFRWGLIIK